MCGIFGIINPKPKKFDYATYSVMGCVNDSRGGDSCGIFIDGNIEYGTGPEDKFFSNYFTKSELLNKTREATIALGHDRKASVGGVDPKGAQPVVLKDKEGNILFVVIHNGTIYNYEELAHKYIPNVDVKGLTDSQVMARIFYYKGYDVLSEYNGGSVFVIVDYRGCQGENSYPKVFFWKGVSKKNEYPVNAEPVEERPFEWVMYKDSFYFSSIGNLFPALLKGCGTIYTMYDNTLVQFVPGEGLKLVKKYDRDKQYQSKKYTSTSYNGNYSSSSSSSSTSKSSTSKKTITHETAFTEGILFQSSGDNLYSRKGKPVHGKAIITTSGRFLKEEAKDSRTVWFYNGIALDLENGLRYFKFLEYLRKKSGLTPDEFVKKFDNSIRYLSFDRLFFKEGVLVQATGANACDIYSGTFHMIGNAQGATYKEGKKNPASIVTGSSYTTPFESYQKTKNPKVELVKFREECISLMS